MLDNSFSFCSNENCTKKDLCLRYIENNKIQYGQTYLVLTEEQCNKNKCFIDKDEYYKNIILYIINSIPNDDLDKKLLLESCYRLSPLSEKYDLKDKLQEKILDYRQKN